MGKASWRAPEKDDKIIYAIRLGKTLKIKCCTK
jgi:hypothetical protein